MSTFSNNCELHCQISLMLLLQHSWTTHLHNLLDSCQKSYQLWHSNKGAFKTWNLVSSIVLLLLIYNPIISIYLIYYIMTNQSASPGASGFRLIHKTIYFCWGNTDSDIFTSLCCHSHFKPMLSRQTLQFSLLVVDLNMTGFWNIVFDYIIKSLIDLCS